MYLFSLGRELAVRQALLLTHYSKISGASTKNNKKKRPEDLCDPFGARKLKYREIFLR
jgi:hypothetical protein